MINVYTLKKRENIEYVFNNLVEEDFKKYFSGKTLVDDDRPAYLKNMPSKGLSKE